MVNIPISHDLDGFIHVWVQDVFSIINNIMEVLHPPKFDNKSPPPLNFSVESLGRPTTQFRDPRISGDFWSNLLKVKWPKVEKHPGDPPTMPFETCKKKKKNDVWDPFETGKPLCVLCNISTCCGRCQLGCNISLFCKIYRYTYQWILMTQWSSHESSWSTEISTPLWWLWWKRRALLQMGFEEGCVFICKFQKYGKTTNIQEQIPAILKSSKSVILGGAIWIMDIFLQGMFGTKSTSPSALVGDSCSRHRVGDGSSWWSDSNAGKGYQGDIRYQISSGHGQIGSQNEFKY